MHKIKGTVTPSCLLVTDITIGSAVRKIMHEGMVGYRLKKCAVFLLYNFKLHDE